MPEKRLDVLIAENTCPRCAAGPGRRCQTPNGKLREPHDERWRTFTAEQEKRTTYTPEEAQRIMRSLVEQRPEFNVNEEGS